ncbi:MAG TPA: class I SAM-dependent methyltransferase [Mycobacterium sp.]|jgi:2-polyprenyl-3-methyl-5-hydroxy-6-metoxy-1,4-benzoquinol methylase|nr:class I SAM-dependent methyltransferase [Mycobacterium sp.]
MKFAYHEWGDALDHDFGIGNHDLVLLSNLVHHFSAIQNAKLIQRLARSLRPHGVLTAIEPIRSEETTSVDQFAGLNELYFGMTSRSEMWRAPEIAQWQRQAGLKPQTEPIMLSGAYLAVQTATKWANDEQHQLGPWLDGPALHRVVEPIAPSTPRMKV